MYSEQVFTSKKGTQCLALDLKEYYDSLEEHQKSRSNAKNVICECPICAEEGHYKHKLYISLDFSIGHCFRCHTAFIDNTRDNNYYHDPSIYETPQLDDLNQFSLVKLSGEKWNLELYEKLRSSNPTGMDYLISRGNPFLPKLAPKLGIKYLGSNPVIPFYFHGELIYYQVKLLEGDIKYFSPPIERKPLYIIEKTDNIARKFVICEGVFDAIACLVLFPDRVPIALLGSSISSYQLWMLNSYVPSDVLIYMDETRLSQGVYNKINSYLDYINLSINPSDGTDPEEYLISKVNK